MFRLKMFEHSSSSDLGLNRNKTAAKYKIEFNRVMQRAYNALATDLISKNKTPCVVCCLRIQEKIHDNNIVDIFFTCSILNTRKEEPHYFIKQS